MNYDAYVTPYHYFKFSEFLVSDSHPEMAERMTLSDDEMDRIRFWVGMIGDPWRIAHPDSRVTILSGKRSLELNEAVGGVPTSDHVSAMAVDSVASGMTAKQYFCSIADMGLPYRQLILYPKENFVHSSINCPCKAVKHQSIIKA